MPQDLLIKIAIIKRMDRFSPLSAKHNALLLSQLLSCSISEQLVRYVSRNSLENIEKDIVTGGNVYGVELNRLQINWDI